MISELLVGAVADVSNDTMIVVVAMEADVMIIVLASAMTLTIAANMVADVIVTRDMGLGTLTVTQTLVVTTVTVVAVTTDVVAGAAVTMTAATTAVGTKLPLVGMILASLTVAAEITAPVRTAMPDKTWVSIARG